MLKKVADLSQNYYYCNKCQYKCSKKNDFDKHLLTLKHNAQKCSQKVAPFNCDCGKIYKHKQSLMRHKDKCTFIEFKEESSLIVKNDDNLETNEELKKLVCKLITENNEIRNTILKENSELRAQVSELIPKVGSNNTLNQKFNIQVFLNEKCKDAVCIKDFIASLQVGLADLDLSRTKGLSYSIANMMVSGLKQLNINERPIHCADKQKEILYVKDEESWEQDKDNALINKSIEKMAEKQRRSINKWIEAHPNWETSETESKEYMQMVQNLMKDVDENKVIFNSIASETRI